MTIDISRKTFDPARNTAWTTTMQGRVATDAPVNEDRTLVDRRLRALMTDLIGRCGYPAAWPTSFEITVAGGALFVGPGRYYVDGHVAEFFGAEARIFDPVLSEARRDGPVAFDAQPYRPGAAPDAPEGGRHLIYLDVWQRDVTALQDATILDPAIPVDTFARRQTVWQVKSFGPLPEGVDCATPDDDIPGWPELIAPSGARLTTRADPAQAASDPCLLPPGAAFRGIDNRSYLYCLHDFDEDGTPLMKFSRSHGVIATRILSQPQGDVLEVVEVAKDDFLRFNPGDWVEITDEARVLAEQPGTMARVLSVDDPANTITLEDPLPAGALRLDGAGPDVDASLQPILRRWDQSGQIRDHDGALIVDLDAPGASGLIPAPADGTFIALEDGVEAALDIAPTGEAPRINDCWTFVARYADNSVEALDAAPPQDTHHHRCRLALVEADDGEWLGPVLSDCRDPIDLGGACCCTVVVSPGEDIQAAIDSLPDDFGGCVCLKPGLHEIREALRIETPNIVLRGESRGVTVRRLGGGTVLRLTGAVGIDIDKIAFEHRPEDGANTTGSGLVEMQLCAGVRLTGCVLRAPDEAGSVGVLLSGCSEVALLDSRFAGVAIGVAMLSRCDEITVEGNAMTLGGPQIPGQFGITARGATGPVHLRQNRIAGALTGISVNDDPTGANRGSLAAGSTVSGNEISMALQPVTGDGAARFFGIDSGAGDTVIDANRLYLAGGARVAIRYSGTGGKITRNLIEVDLNADDDGENTGIFIGPEEDTPHLTRQITVTGNSLRDVTAGIVAREVTDIQISGNEIDASPGRTILPGIMLDGATRPRVTDNSIREAWGGIFATGGRLLHCAGNTITDCAFGIVAATETQPTIAQNALTNIAMFGALTLLTVAQTKLSGNRFGNVGWSGGAACAIGGIMVLGDWEVEGNEILNTGLPLDGAPNGSAVAGIRGALILESRIDANTVTYSNIADLPDGREDRALQLQGLLEISIPVSDRRLAFGFPCQITNNKFIGKGQSALVELRQTDLNDTIRLRFERVFFNHNYCLHAGPGDAADSDATVILTGSAGVVMGNQVKAQERFIPSINMRNMTGTMVGNITSAGFAQDPNFPVNEADFNRQI
ncbi:DUF6519 domain-containing protein [Poseidonocella sedimentorum]|uniref:Copper-binding protein (NosD) n=1 Tax=Poseidonocella sedimentorum TaxID=871652 RepID=A0A1I6DPM2_9RHOB|nr:DUF6519 domain-containing protein [Poseidonocella sedimentorum]SFR07308.1 copper-binding protein (NosD) [Poseidonocella sedimentorum]